MKEKERTKAQPMKELAALRKQVTKLEKAKEKNRLTDEALRESEQRFRIAAESSSDLIWEWDILQGSLEWFGEIDEMLGYARGKFPRTIEAWEDIIHPEDHDRVTSVLGDHLTKGSLYYAEYRVRRKDGSFSYWTDRGVALRDKKGKPYKMIGACSDITERKRAENELKDAKDFLENVFKTTADGIMVSDSKGYVARINRAIEKMLGYAEEEIVGKHTAELTPQDEPHMEIGIRMLTELREKGFIKDFEGCWLKKDGNFCPIELNITMLKDSEGKSAGAVSVIRDITERKRAEEQIHYQANLLKNVSDAVVAGDRNNIVRSWNRAAEKIYGWKAEEAIGRSGIDLFQTTFLSRERKDVYQQIFEDGHWEGEVIQKHKDGRDIHILGSISLLKDVTGETIGFVSIGLDITERKRAEEQIGYQADLLQQVSDSIISSDKDFRITSWNKAAEKIYGWKAEDVTGTSVVDLLKTQFVDQEREDVYNWIFENGYWEGEFIQEQREGKQIHMLGSISLLKDAEGKVIGFVSMGHDITAWKRVEEEKERLQSQLLQAQKLEAIGTLAGGVAHDFNNILTAIQGNVELAMLKVDEANPLYRDLKQIRNSALRAANLTRQLLLFSRRQPMELFTLRINRTISDLLEMLKRIIGEDVTITTDFAPDLWTVRADAGNIEQAIMNLTANARDAMPDGGKIIIKTENVILDKEYCKVVPEARPGKFVRISVADTGCGMERETLRHIFEPFFTTKEAGKGTGLGLAVVYGIVKQHDGWINIYSEPGQGSIFRLYLPAFSGKLKEEVHETVSIKEFAGRGERVLLVEDEEEVLDFAARVLRENGYEVWEAASAREAIDIFKKEQGNFNLIFSDVVLPDENGIQLVDRLLALKPDLRVLLSSGYSDHKLQWPIIQERKYRFLQKPYSLPDLLRVLREVIG